MALPGASSSSAGISGAGGRSGHPGSWCTRVWTSPCSGWQFPPSGPEGWGVEGSGVKMLPAAARRPGSWALTNAGPLHSEPGLWLALQQALGCRNCNFLGHNVRWNGSLYQQEWHSNLSLGMQCIQTPHFLNEMNYNNPLKDRVLEMLRNVDSIFFFFFPIVRGTWWWWPWEGGGGTFPELGLKSTASGIRAQKRELPDGGSKGLLCVLQTHPSLPVLGPFSLSLALSSPFFLSSSFPPSLPCLPLISTSLVSTVCEI